MSGNLLGKKQLMVGILCAGMASPFPTAADVEAAKGFARSGRIVGGNAVVLGVGPQFPWQVSLNLAGFGHFCGGSLIVDNEEASWVVTAAHCVDFLSGPGEVTVVSGTLKLSDSATLEQEVVKILPHGDYDPNTFDNDIALLKLKPLTDDQRSSERAGPEWRAVIALPSALEAGELNQAYNKSSVSGWGATSEGGPSPDDLLYVDVPLVDHESCKASYDEVGMSVTTKMLCAGYRSGGHDACQGDSGGPIAVNSTRTGQPNLVGVVSWGRGCARHLFFGVYTRITAYLPWTRSQMEAN